LIEAKRGNSVASAAIAKPIVENTTATPANQFRSLSRFGANDGIKWV
jgi:hypothetical protein